jgi:hypothetical protein
MGGGTTRKTTRVRFTKGEGMEKGLKYIPHKGDGEIVGKKKDPDLDIDCKGCGGAGGCKPAGPKNDPLPRLILKGKGD